MTKGLMEGMKEPQGRKLFETVNEYFNISGAASPAGLRELSFYGIMEDALRQLRNLIKKGIVTWKEPFAQLEYDFPEQDAPSFLTGRAEYSFMFYLTRGVGVEVGQPGRIKSFSVADFSPEWKKLQAGRTEEELAAGFDFSDILKSSGTFDTPRGEEAFSVGLRFAIRPLTNDPNRKKIFFPVHVGLNIIEGDPSAWSEANQAEIWKGFERIIGDLSLPHLKELIGKGEERLPIPKPDKVIPIRPEVFAAAAGFVPMHKLAERNLAGLPLFPEASRTFHALRTPLNVATGLALFRFTSPDRPGDWQEATIHALTDQVYCLTERDAPRRGDHAPDVLAEVVKLFSETIAIVTPRHEKHGRLWTSRVNLIFDRIIATLGLTYIDTKTGRRVYPDDPSLPRDAIVPLNVKGRRVYTPDGRDIKAMIGDRWKLETIRWRWSPTIVDDLLATPALDKKGKVKRDRSGKVIRGGFNILVVCRIFDALFRLRSEKAYIAHDLLVLLAMDIYKPPKQSNAARNIVEREAGRLYDLLGLEDDPKHPGRREEAVMAAIFRLKQPDIGALLAGSDEIPRTDPNPNRRKGNYYRLIRSALYTPPGILTKDEVAALEAEEASEPLALPDPKGKKDQDALPGIIGTTPPIPSGSDIKAARETAGVTIRDFAALVKGPAIGTWSHYETGKPIRVGKISPEVWQRVRDFILQYGKKGSEGEGGKA